MSSQPSLNPYQPNATIEDVPMARPPILPRVLLVVIALVLLLRGISTGLGWAIQFSFGIEPSIRFLATIFLEDMIYAVSAFAGGVLLIARKSAGWWLAMVHWCWYVATEVVLVATAALAGWANPPRFDPPHLYRVLLFTTVVALIVVGLLNWKPICDLLRPPLQNRRRSFAFIMIPCVILALLLNAILSIR